jgi:hypothetical protein
MILTAKPMAPLFIGHFSGGALFFGAIDIEAEEFCHGDWQFYILGQHSAARRIPDCDL